MDGGVMLGRQIAIEKQMSSLIGKRIDIVYHPQGEFDKFALIDVLCKFECCHGYRAEIIVMTTKQWQQAYQKELEFSQSVLLGKDSDAKVMGCKVVVDDIPSWSVAIEWER
jgi:hypothetical protein